MVKIPPKDSGFGIREPTEEDKDKAVELDLID